MHTHDVVALTHEHTDSHVSITPDDGLYELAVNSTPALGGQGLKKTPITLYRQGDQLESSSQLK